MSDIFDLDEIDDFAYRIWKTIETKHDDVAREKIKARDAAQRQAGRNEALVEMADNAVRLKKHYDDALAVIDARYTALEEAARPFAQYEDGDAGKCWDPSRIKLGKALDDLDEARKR